MDPATPYSVYTARLAGHNANLRHLEIRRRRASWLRLVSVALVILAVWFTIQHQIPAWVILLPLAAFVGLIAWHSRIDRATELVRRAVRFYERGLARLENRWQGSGETGDRFADPHHPYASDLDIFGRASLFQLLCTARTKGGETKLADWLKSPAGIAELRKRQAAVDELRPLLDLREKIAVLGDDFRSDVNPGQLATWAGATAQRFPSILRWAAFLLALIQAAFLIWWASTLFVGIRAEICVIVAGLFEAAFVASLHARILAVVHSAGEPSHDLDLLSQILAVLEGEDFHSRGLADLRGRFRRQGAAASDSIARLRRYVELLDSRDNVFVRVLGPPLLWTTQTAMAIENWRAEHGAHIAGWIEAVSEFEALSCLASYAWENPADPWPEFSDTPVFDGREIGHPLLPNERCVRNSVALQAPVALLVVSGSNMSGKSTLLRSVGANAVLALAGAPVRAASLAISPLSIGASIRTVDSLEEGHSRFMAEILRLKQILELPAPVLFLLDELLHGTNSHDRAIGAEGLVRALLERGNIGITTTHDLSLARVADQLAPAAINVHFEDRVEDGRLVFDYRMRAGVVERSNALDLMRSVGLDV